MSSLCVTSINIDSNRPHAVSSSCAVTSPPPPHRIFLSSASRFGAVLDMVTDRCSTAGLLLVLSRLYGRLHAFGFLVLMFVDLFSHWMHTHR